MTNQSNRENWFTNITILVYIPQIKNVLREKKLDLEMPPQILNLKEEGSYVVAS